MNRTIITFAIITITMSVISCQKEDDTFTSGMSPVFSGSIDNEAPTKTSITNERKVNWESTDKISINGAIYSATPDGSDATKAIFTKESGEDPTGLYYAYFPSTIHNGVIGTLPSVQTYTAGKIDAPMYAESATTSLSFKNLCAILAIKVTSAQMSNVRKIRVKSSNFAMSGTFIVSAGNHKLYLLNPGETSNMVTLDCGSGVDTSAEGTVFYVYIPPQDYLDLTIELSADGTQFTKIMSTLPNIHTQISPNSIYSINFVSAVIYTEGAYSGAAIKIGDVYWAPVNCGYDESHTFGLLYEWGRLYGQIYKDEKIVEPGTFTAVKLYVPPGYSDTRLTSHPDNTPSNRNKYYYNVDNWYNGTTPAPNDLWKEDGSSDYNPCPDGWRIPTKSEFEALLGGNTTPTMETYAGKSGIWLNGTSSPDSKGVFLPASGHNRCYGGDSGYRGSRVRYWTSTPYISGTDNSYSLQFDGIAAGINSIARSTGHSIRCVKK